MPAEPELNVSSISVTASTEEGGTLAEEAAAAAAAEEEEVQLPAAEVDTLDGSMGMEIVA
jgi:hypothetical protein